MNVTETLSPVLVGGYAVFALCQMLHSLFSSGEQRALVLVAFSLVAVVSLLLPTPLVAMKIFLAILAAILGAMWSANYRQRSTLVVMNVVASGAFIATVVLSILRGTDSWVWGLFGYLILEIVRSFARDLSRLRAERERADRFLIAHRFREDFLLSCSGEIEALFRRLSEVLESMDHQSMSSSRLATEVRSLERFVTNMFEYLRIKHESTAADKPKTGEDQQIRLQELQEELNHAKRLRKELYSNISHDLRTPLTSINGYVEAILTGMVSTREQEREYLKRVQARVNGLIKLVEELTMSLQLETGQTELSKEFVMVDEVLRSTQDKYLLDAALSGLKLSLIPLQRATRIAVDVHRLDRVFGNLITNSIRHTPSGGMITLGAEQREGHVVFFVRDTGLGIMPEDLPRVFERFFMGSAARSSQSGNSGLGLSIAKEIVQAHGGEIWIDSAPGRGTTVFFRLPAAI